MSASGANRASAWAWTPPVLWVVCVVVAVVWSRESFVFDAGARAAGHYDAGTRAAMSGDLGRAVLELRRAQAMHAPWWRDADALGDRIEGNLREARRRVAAAAVGAGEGVAPSADPATVEGRGQGRPLGEVALAYVRSVPIFVRIALAAAAAGLAFALGASRLLARGTADSRSARPPPWSPWLAACVAAAFAGIAAVDGVVDARRGEAVLVRAVLPRQGPDDLTYAPAAAVALPAGSEARVIGRTADGLWVRLAPTRQSGTGGVATAAAGAGWAPASAVEMVIPPRGE